MAPLNVGVLKGAIHLSHYSPLIKSARNMSPLPRLPVPQLRKTLDKYLRTVRPHLKDDEYRTASEAANNFVAPGGSGEKLQERLEKRAKISENWLSDWWLENAYLTYRLPVVVYSSPGLVFPLQHFREYALKQDQVEFAAKVIIGALRFKKKIDDGQLQQETMGNAPLDMSQYRKVYGTCRVPGHSRDDLVYSPESSHVVVVHNNQFFKLDVFTADGEIIPRDKLIASLFQVVIGSDIPAPPVGILTSENRNTWAKSYSNLVANPRNHASVEAIKNSLFLVCLDGAMPDLGAPNRQTVAAFEMIHGGGSRGNAGNRWYDKTIQFIIGLTGEVGLTYEHSPSEGPPIANMMDYIMEYIEKVGPETIIPGDIISPLRRNGPELLEFELAANTLKDIDVAKLDLDILVDDLEMTCFTFEEFGKSNLKRLRVSPDSFIQVAIQLAFYRIHGEPGAQYESASTRKFIHGRTETIRSCLPEVVDFCAKMVDGKSSSKEQLAALLAGINAHKQYASEAVSGEGVDRHLLGLKLVAIESGMDLPPLFLDYGYLKSSHMRLSTSQVPAKCDSFMCYGPLVPDGYGCCYNPRETTINFGISAFNSSPSTHSGKYKEILEQTLCDMHNLLFEYQKAKL